jgi:signal transduction histidine kinase
MSGDTTELLRAKAMLLLRREREVHEFRQERTRIETWLRAYQDLTPARTTDEGPSLEERWVTAMVRDLSFQVACIYAARQGEASLRLVAGAAPDELPVDVGFDVASLSAASGEFDGGSPAELDPIARALALGRCHWFRTQGGTTPLLFLAGFRADTARFHALNRDDAPHFVLLGGHVAALLENAALITELERERRELYRSNQQLDESLTELREVQETLVRSSQMLAESSRRAGMADVATGVLHNVGNVANSVNVSAEVLAGRLRGMKIAGLGRLAELLSSQAERLPEFLRDDPRGRNVLPYLKGLAIHLATDQEGLIAEVMSLVGHIDHLKAIVSKQQAYAMTFDMAQPCHPTEVMDDALELCSAALLGHGVQVTRDYESVPRLLLDRHKVLQILVNLITNAQDAVAECERKRVWLSVRCRNERLELEVRDEGAGISAGDLERIFRHGFTTKPTGHGFGLHASVLAAREMGGSLTARSEGLSRGATFTLELPVRPAPSLAPNSRPTSSHARGEPSRSA